MTPIMRAASISLFAIVSLWGESAMARVDVNAEIQRKVEEIKAAEDPRLRTDLASSLTDYVRNHAQPGAVDGRAIDDVASLLADDLDSVRLWAALALGQIGPSARRAVPELHRALAREKAGEAGDIKLPEVSSVSAIDVALDRIAADR